MLYEHPAVLEAAVVGVPHETLGEDVAAIVVPRTGTPTRSRRAQGVGEGARRGIQVPAPRRVRRRATEEPDRARSSSERSISARFSRRSNTSSPAERAPEPWISGGCTAGFVPHTPPALGRQRPSTLRKTCPHRAERLCGRRPGASGRCDTMQDEPDRPRRGRLARAEPGMSYAMARLHQRLFAGITERVAPYDAHDAPVHDLERAQLSRRSTVDVAARSTRVHDSAVDERGHPRARAEGTHQAESASQSPQDAARDPDREGTPSAGCVRRGSQRSSRARCWRGSRRPIARRSST